MPETVIQIDNVWKKYRLGTVGTGTLAHDMNRWWHRIRGKPDPYAKVGGAAASKIEDRSLKIGKDTSNAEDSNLPSTIPHLPSPASALSPNSDLLSPSATAAPTPNSHLQSPGPLGADEMWALRGMSLEIKQGEIVGIIGKNGAGKSTLLKILSRVTAPTHGEVRVKGRIASLLEVGTGFHPELTGRENIFLNGAILGMTKAEIKRKLDEIVAFAEIEKFLDTPVKRYSSGMYVRLAFAVAAHLDPEILIVDEVLAVGDADFQKKCLGKMGEVAKGGRTVLFVSHNMETILKLSTRGILILAGQESITGEINQIVGRHLADELPSCNVVDLRTKARSSGIGKYAFFVRAIAGSNVPTWRVPFLERLKFELIIEATRVVSNIQLGLGLFSLRGFEIASWTSTYAQVRLPLKVGLNKISLEYKAPELLPGQYYLALGLRSERGFEDYLPDAIRFEITMSARSASINSNSFGGIILPTVEAVVA